MKITALILLLILSVSCTQQTVQHISPPPAEAQAELADVGTGDSGGGNGVNGKALEEYRIPLQKIESYESIVKPHVESLKAKIPEFGAQLENIFKGRLWYFVPKTLSTLKSDQIGVAFATEQLALQNTYEVWIDKVKFDEMTPQEQATLLIHEALMGIKINLDQTYKDQLSRRNSPRFGDLFNEQENVIEISKVDYSRIRTMTSLITDARYLNSIGDFILQLEEMKFGQFVAGEDLNKIHSTFNRDFGVSEVLSWFESESLTGTLPPSCQFEASASKLSLKVTRGQTSKIVQLADLQVRPQVSIKGVVEITFFTAAEEKLNSNRTKVFISVQHGKISYVELSEEVYALDLRSITSSWRKKDGKQNSVVCPTWADSTVP